jgi:hypothetical protein
MKILHLTERAVSPKAVELMEFDRDSIRQVVASAHGEPQPELWLSDPDQYERDGRILRDSATPRLVAYSPQSRTLYVTDGCNSCSHQLEADLNRLTADQLQVFAKKTGIPLELLSKLKSHTPGPQTFEG